MEENQDIANAPESSSVTADTPDTTPTAPPRYRRWCVAAAIIGFVCCMVAWAQMFFNEVASIWLGVIALVLSIAGVMAGRSFWRDLAITSILASAVLLIVYAIFFFGINILINSL